MWTSKISINLCTSVDTFHIGGLLSIVRSFVGNPSRMERVENCNIKLLFPVLVTIVRIIPWCQIWTPRYIVGYKHSNWTSNWSLHHPTDAMWKTCFAMAMAFQIKLLRCKYCNYWTIISNDSAGLWLYFSLYQLLLKFTWIQLLRSPITKQFNWTKIYEFNKYLQLSRFSRLNASFSSQA